jgi:hypothetical protein
LRNSQFVYIFLSPLPQLSHLLALKERSIFAFKSGGGVGGDGVDVGSSHSGVKSLLSVANDMQAVWGRLPKSANAGGDGGSGDDDDNVAPVRTHTIVTVVTVDVTAGVVFGRLKAAMVEVTWLLQVNSATVLHAHARVYMLLL